jgi:hypothetical protein
LGGWLEKSEGVIFSNWEYKTDVDTYFGADWDGVTIHFNRSSY